jgi:hypothetical protein
MSKRDAVSSSKKKVVASASNSSWLTSLSVVVSVVAIFGLFAYILGHSHLTLGKHDDRLKFITNKIESFSKSSKGMYYLVAYKHLLYSDGYISHTNVVYICDISLM